MYVLGTPSVSQGGPSRSFQAKNLYVVVPLLATLNVVMQKGHMLFLHTLMGFYGLGD